MTPSVAELESQALTLSAEDRVALADRLLASVDDEPDVEDAWAEEAARRLEELDSGAVTDSPVDTAIARACRDPMIVTIHPLADAELVEAARYYARKAGATVAEALVAEFGRSVRLLGERPGLGAPWRRSMRRLPLRRFPYSIVYHERPADLRIVALAHHRRRPGYWRGRVGSDGTG